MSLSIRKRVRNLLRSRFSVAESELNNRDHDLIYEAERQCNDQTSKNLQHLSSVFANAHFTKQCDVESPTPSHDSITCATPNGRNTKMPEVYSGKTGLDLPKINLQTPSPKVYACFTGPDGGLTKVQQMRQQPIIKMANLDDELTLSIEDETTSSSFVQEARNNQNGKDNTSTPFRTLIHNETIPHEVNDSLRHINGASTSETSQCIASQLQLPQTSTLFSAGSLEALGFTQSDLVLGASTNNYNWNTWDEEKAYGLSTSLYEKHPVTGITAGTPIADVFGIIAREDNCVLALADGVNWGEGARLAARCAVRGALDHMNAAIENSEMSTTTEVFHWLLGAFHAAHALILQEGGALTTLCVAFVAQVRDSESSVLCVCNVGDSLCFIYNFQYGVREVTLASHDIGQMRDMRDAGGALGPVDGRNPQLHNLTCSMTFVDDGDIVFITSDGISDNFDPVVGKFCVIKNVEEKENAVIEKKGDGVGANRLIPTERYLLQQIPQKATKMMSTFHKTKSEPNATNKIQGMQTDELSANIIPTATRRRTAASLLPCVDALERHKLMLLRMADVITNDTNSSCSDFFTKNTANQSPKIFETCQLDKNTSSPICYNSRSQSISKSSSSTSASELCKHLTQFAYRISAAKRRTLEDPELYRTRTHSKTEERLRRKMIRNMIAEMPGKLDHASVVAYRIGLFPPSTSQKHDKSLLSSTPHPYDYISNTNNENIIVPPLPLYGSLTDAGREIPENMQSTRSLINCDVALRRVPEHGEVIKTVEMNEGELTSSRRRLVLDIPPELQVDYQISFSPTTSARRSPYEEQSNINNIMVAPSLRSHIPHSGRNTQIQPGKLFEDSASFNEHSNRHHEIVNSSRDSIDGADSLRRQNNEELPKRRRHLRNSLARHTLAVDITWLKRLVLSNRNEQ